MKMALLHHFEKHYYTGLFHAQRLTEIWKTNKLHESGLEYPYISICHIIDISLSNFYLSDCHVKVYDGMTALSISFFSQVAFAFINGLCLSNY